MSEQFILLLWDKPGSFDGLSMKEMGEIVGRYTTWKDKLAADRA